MPITLVPVIVWCQTMWTASMNDPEILACNVGSIVSLAMTVVLLVKTVRLRRSIRARLRELAAARRAASVCSHGKTSSS